MKFGKARLYRSDISSIHRLQFKLFGIADPSHFLRSQYFKRYANILNSKTVLDAGCGGGDYSFYMAEYWPQAKIISVDVNEENIAKNKLLHEKWGLKNIFFQNKDISSLCEKEKYDLIVCVDVLEHIEDQEKVLANFYSALKDKGYLYIHIPLKRPRPEPLKKYLKEFHGWAEREHIGKERTKEKILEMIQKSNFTVIKNQSTFYYSFGEMACSLFNIFFQKTSLNHFVQGLLAPVTRLLCYGELIKIRDEGFALAVLAQKKEKLAIGDTK